MKFFQRLIATVFPSMLLRNSRTVQYAFSFSFFLLFASVLGMAAVGTKSTSSVRIVSDATTVEEGATFTIDVLVYASVPVNAVDVTLSFPTNQVEILAINKGESVITLWTEDPRVEGGSVILRGGTYKKGFVGEHRIVSLSVRAKSAGEAKFLTSNVKLLAGDGKGTDVTADISKAIARTDIVPVGSLPAVTVKGNVAVIVATDVDGDGQISLKDISSFMASWTTRDVTYDFNNDGVMTFRDFSILLADFFTGK
jgi:hypothetical protein